MTADPSHSQLWKYEEKHGRDCSFERTVEVSSGATRWWLAPVASAVQSPAGRFALLSLRRR
jgi:hypothetical protein